MLELDLAKIKANEARSSTENRHFRRFLQKEDESEIESLLVPIMEEVKLQIDCQQCGNCCKNRLVDISRSEAHVIAGYLGESSENFWKENVKFFDGDSVLSQNPCRFLDKTECTLGAIRPDDCKKYPYFFEKNFAQCMHTPILNYTICPIVYNVLERLKIVTGYSYPFDAQ